MLILLIVAACFALGFVAGPDLVRNWPIMEDVRQIVHDKLNHVKAVAIKGSSTAPPASSNDLAPTPNTSTKDQTVAPVQPAPAAASAAAPIAPDTTAPPAENAAPGANTPNASTTTNVTVASDTAPRDKATSGDDGKSDEANASAPPAVTASAPAPAVKGHRSLPPESTSSATESPAPAKETPVEKSYVPPEVKAAPSAAVNTPRDFAPPAASTRPRESSTPPNNSSVPNSSTPNNSTPNSSTSAKGASAPPTHPPTPPPSYFPVVAPAAGNVPRLIELPEEKVIDTAAVVIHSHQIVFVPAEPGPESSHKLEKLQIGDRTTKLAPTYPPQAVQKGMGGTVHLRAIVGKDGSVQDVRPINGPILLIPAAVEAIRQWQYQPTLLDQQPIEMQEDFTIEFRPLGVQAKQ